MEAAISPTYKEAGLLAENHYEGWDELKEIGTEMTFTKKVACGNFVKRQTKESGSSYFDGTWEELESMLEDIISNDLDCIHPGYRDGVVLVDLPADFFYSAIVELNDKSKLTANYSARREGEEAYIKIGAKAQKQPAKYASVVLYRWDILAENNERETDAEWEIVCIKARVSEEVDPMHYYTMARNFLHLKGGTQGDFTAEQFAKSIVYWSQHAITTGKPKWYKKLAQWIRGY